MSNHGRWLFAALGQLAVGQAVAQPREVPVAVEERISGRVIDSKSRRPIAKAVVSVDGAVVSASTGPTGRFTIMVRRGTTLIVSAVGFELALVTADRSDLGDVALAPEGTTTEVIEVTSDAPSGAPGATRISRDDVGRMPGTSNDLGAALTVLPGVTTTQSPRPTGRAGIIIRGSAPEDSRILVDGFEVPILYHSIAFRTILPIETIDNLEYMPGGFDVSFGRASSGIVAVRTRGGTRDFGGHAEMSVIDGGALTRGPVGKTGTFMIAARRSTLDYILPAVIPDDANVSFLTVPRYYDAQARLDLAIGKRWTLAISSFGASDALELLVPDEDDPDRGFSNRSRFVRTTADARWHRGEWSARLAGSMLTQNVAFSAGRDLSTNVGRVGGALRTEASRTMSQAVGLRDVVVRFGTDIEVTRHALSLSTPRIPDEGEPDMGFGGSGEIDQRFDGVIWVPDLAGYSSVGAGFGRRIRVTGGVRVDGFVRIGDVAVQPRGELAIKLRSALTARFAAGAYRRPPENQTELLDDKLRPERSTQLIAGVEHAPRPGTKLQLSAYHTDRTSLLTRTDDGGFANQGRGTTIGAEILATHRTGPWFAWLSYSLSRSTRIDQPGADERLFDYDQPHDLTAAVSWRRGKWQLGARFQFASGTPYTPVTGAVLDSDADRYTPIYGAVNSDRVEAHHQIDVRIDRYWKVGPARLSAFLDVQNVYMNKSVVGYTYSFDYSERAAFESIPILPSIGLRGEI